jgi:NRPS condensation-like uncharacterized protein
MPLCEVIETTEVQREVERFAARPCDATCDPLVQACIVRAASDTLCLKISHVAADGAGGKELLYLIASLYRGLENPDHRVTPNLISRGSLPFLRQFGFGRCLRALRFRPRKPPDSVWCFPSQDLPSSGPRRFARRRLSAAESAHLREYASKASASLNDVLLAAFFRALWRFLDFPPGIPQPVWMPMDLRAFQPSGQPQAIRNFVAMLYPALARVPEETLGDTLRRVQESSLTPEQQKEYALFFQVLLVLSHHLLLKKMEQNMESRARQCRETGATSAHFANNRTISPTRLDFGVPVADVDQFPPAAIPPALFVGALSFAGSIRFSISYFSAAVKSEEVERFFDTFMEELSSVKERPALAAAAHAGY